MSAQLKETSQNIEEAVVEVCMSFQGIAQRARANVSRTTNFLGREGGGASGHSSFNTLIQTCGATMVKILNTTAESGDVSRRAIERIQQMDKASQQISIALRKLEDIASGNKILALNARIEAAHSGRQGEGFKAVAVELASQTDKSRDVTEQVGELASALRSLAESTVADLQRLQDRDHERVERCRWEVDESLAELQAAHAEMKEMMNAMTEDGALLANDIGNAVRGLQFQDRTSQRIAHVIQDLETLQSWLLSRAGDLSASEPASDEGFSAYTMKSEREVGGIHEEESAAGDVELF
jgi:methyl-accepting chemotaxis protein